MSETLIKKHNHFIDLVGLDNFYIAISLFKEKARNRGLTSAEHVIYNVLRGHELSRGFTPVTNETKLNNGMNPNFGFDNAKSNAKWLLANKSMEILSQWKEEQKLLLSKVNF